MQNTPILTTQIVGFFTTYN